METKAAQTPGKASAPTADKAESWTAAASTLQPLPHSSKSAVANTEDPFIGNSHFQTVAVLILIDCAAESVGFLPCILQVCSLPDFNLLSPARFSSRGSAAEAPQSRGRPPPPHSGLEPTPTSATTLLPELASSHQVRRAGMRLEMCAHAGTALSRCGDTRDRCNPMDLKPTQGSLIRQLDIRYTRSLLYQAYMLRQRQFFGVPVEAIEAIEHQPPRPMMLGLKKGNSPATQVSDRASSPSTPARRTTSE